MKKSIFDKHVTDGDHYAYATSTDKFHQKRLTKRELFAAMAMQGSLLDGKDIDEVAFYSVRAADLLIAELNKEVQS